MSEASILQKKRFLESYQDTMEELKDIEDQIRSCRERRTSPSAGTGRGQRSAGSSDLSSYAARIDSLERMRSRKAKKLKTIRHRIENSIRGMPDETERDKLYREILRCKYIELMSWSDIARRIHYSERHTKRLLEAALEAFEEL